MYYLDLAAKLDQTAEYECSRAWGKIEFPAPFGRESLPEEAYIAELDSKTGSSLKLTILNKEGRVWTMVAGGGASVVYRSPFFFLFVLHGHRHFLLKLSLVSLSPTAMPLLPTVLPTSSQTMVNIQVPPTSPRPTSTPRPFWI